jgi:hypothetical protein
MKTNGVFGVRRVSSCTTKSQPTEKHPHSWCFCDSFCCDCVWNWDRSWLYCPSTLELGIEMMPLFLQISFHYKEKEELRERDSCPVRLFRKLILKTRMSKKTLHDI